MTVRTTSRRGGDASAAAWEASLVAGALRDEIAAAQLGSLIGTTIHVNLPDGAEFESFGGLGRSPVGLHFPDMTTASAVSSIRANAVAVGLRVSQIQLRTAMQLAPVVIATTSDPAGFVTRAFGSDLVTKQIFGAPDRFEGFLIKVFDSAGGLFFEQDYSARAGQGSLWIRPDLRPPDGASWSPANSFGG